MDLYQIFKNNNVINIILSNSKDKLNPVTKIEIKPLMIKNKLIYQFSSFTKQQVFHKNYEPEEAFTVFEHEIKLNFKQAQIYALDGDYHVLSNRLQELTIKKTKASKNQLRSFNHNQEKQYIIPANTFIYFLYELGIITLDGKLIASKSAKFRQINRFLEFIEDIVKDLVTEEIQIIDFGCGKSYLTFAIHYYFKEILKREVNIIGLDLKEEVIHNCNQIVDRYELKGIKFLVGDIKDYQTNNPVDLVVSLHACDTATDYALAKAINWQAKVILAVPCCQHELNAQFNPSNFEVFSKYGIIKERISSLLTDVTRAELLSQKGYKTQILEFIDIEHTPKNLLIRAVKSNIAINGDEQVKALKREFNYELTLEKLLKNK